MKVVLFCGGMGMRLREYSEVIPKPMVNIGYRPLIWHLMKYYAHYGHTEFVLCLGHRGDVIKEYFLNYNECLSNDFVLSRGGRDLQLRSRDIDDWQITFVDTGPQANVGQRLRAVEPYLDGADVFMANYSDGLTDLPLPEYLSFFGEQNRIASFVCVRPQQTFHVVSMARDGLVSSVRHVSRAGFWMNGGFFVFKKEIFRYINDGEELVEEPFRRLIAEEQLTAYRYDGFWACMDTFRDKQRFDSMNACGETPWHVWKSALPAARQRTVAGAARTRERALRAGDVDAAPALARVEAAPHPPDSERPPVSYERL